MKNKIKIAICICTGIFLMGGCSLTPYQSEFSCTKGVNNGKCESVSESYSNSFTKEKVGEIDSLAVLKQDKKEHYFNEEVFKNLIEKCEEKHSSVINNFEKNRRSLQFNECLNNSMKQIVNEMKEDTNSINEMIYYQNMENERLHQKNNLLQAKGDSK